MWGPSKVYPELISIEYFHEWLVVGLKKTIIHFADDTYLERVVSILEDRTRIFSAFENNEEVAQNQ